MEDEIHSIVFDVSVLGSRAGSPECRPDAAG